MLITGYKCVCTDGADVTSSIVFNSTTGKWISRDRMYIGNIDRYENNVKRFPHITWNNPSNHLLSLMQKTGTGLTDNSYFKYIYRYYQPYGYAIHIDPEKMYLRCDNYTSIKEISVIYTTDYLDVPEGTEYFKSNEIYSMINEYVDLPSIAFERRSKEILAVYIISRDHDVDDKRLYLNRNMKLIPTKTEFRLLSIKDIYHNLING